MRRSAALLAVAFLSMEIGCSKEEGNQQGNTGKSGESAAAPASGSDKSGAQDKGAAAGQTSSAPAGDSAVDPASLAQKVGVEPGPIEYEKDEGAAAVVASVKGTVEVRRVGTETWEKAAAEAQLRAGDQVRAGDGGQAVITLVDESSIEVAEESAIAIGSRDATADPASSAATLYGVARFTVAERAPGEGPFMVFAPGGMIATKGTVYTVGVIASGATRVGVESGEVEVAGSSKLDAPVAVTAGKVIVVEPDGDLGAVGAMGEADWGAWRDGAEAEVDPKSAAEYHRKRAEALEAELDAAYAELEAQTAAAADAEAEAEAAAEANDNAAYVAAAPELGGAVDASFAASLRLQYLTSAMLAHAYVADALYVRHPAAVAVIEPARPRLAAAVLWQKKYHAVADLHVQPLRARYYVHHPMGRVRAKLVAYPIPPFYARVKLDYRPPVVTTRVKFAVYRPPVVRASVRVKRKVFVRTPRVGWYAGVRTRVRPAPVRGRWYVRPAAPRSRVVFGARPSASVRVKTVFRAEPPRPRAKAVVRFGGGVTARGDRRHRVEVRDRRPDVEVRDHRGRADVRGGAAVNIKAGVRAPAVEVRDHRSRAEVRGGARVKVKESAHRVESRGRAKADVRASARVKVKAPKPPKIKVKAPKVKGSVNVKAKAGVKLGN
jgi:FecR protein